MNTIYLVNILNKTLIYSKYTLINVTIILRPFILIILLEYNNNLILQMGREKTYRMRFIVGY
jgi:hypothetical protein